MKADRDTASLGSVLRYRKQFIEVNDLATYKRCRVQTQAQGIVPRDIVTGAELKTKRQQVCRTGDFLVAEIDAKIGGFGIVSSDLDGAIVSSHYFLFEIDSTLLDRRFLGWFVKTKAFLDQVRAQGSTNYAAIRPSDVLAYRVPLPPLEEQRRIVARIDGLAGKIEEAHALCARAGAETKTLIDSLVHAAFERTGYAERVPLGQVTETITKGTTPKTYGHTFVDLGVPFLRAEEVKDGEVAWWLSPHFLSADTNDFMQRSVAHPGDVLVTIAGTIGRSAVVPHNAPVLNMNQAVALVRPTHAIDPRYLSYFIRSPQGQKQITGGTVTTAISNISLSTLRTLRLPLPPIPEQRALVARLERLQAWARLVTERHDSIARELGALLPSIVNRTFTGRE